jgi:hypothetical protein
MQKLWIRKKGSGIAEGHEKWQPIWEIWWTQGITDAEVAVL